MRVFENKSLTRERMVAGSLVSPTRIRILTPSNNGMRVSGSEYWVASSTIQTDIPLPLLKNKIIIE